MCVSLFLCVYRVTVCDCVSWRGCACGECVCVRGAHFIYLILHLSLLHFFGRVSLSELYDDPATQNSRNDDKTRTKYKIHLSQKTNNNLAKLWKF